MQFFKKRGIKLVGFTSKIKNPQKYIPVDQRYSYCIFITHVDVNVWQKISDDFTEFHHFMKKEQRQIKPGYLQPPWMKTKQLKQKISNCQEPMGFRKLQEKKTRGKFRQANPRRKQATELPSFFMNLLTVETTQLSCACETVQEQSINQSMYFNERFKLYNLQIYINIFYFYMIYI